jgi:NADH-quinone oxidoreductase subunit G
MQIEINGLKLDVTPGSMIIEAADAAGIPIPRFCYHKKLSIAANCRMCLVEVKNSRKPLPACATPVTEGMQVFTKSPMAAEAQRSVMEFLLINHPLDCPICDQGGECELQDLSLEYGDDISRFSERKRAVDDENLGPLIATDMTRCILCTRCVRFGDEIAGMRELGSLGRGEHSEIKTFVAKSVESEISGNIIDLCPVGALTSKPYRFTARAWELAQHAHVSPHDCVGSNLFLHTKSNRVMRVAPRENENINEMWLSDRDRFSYVGLQASDRVLKPRIKENGQWHEVEWEKALLWMTERTQSILHEHGPDQIAALIAPQATTEEMFLWQKLWRALQVKNIDHRLRAANVDAQQFWPRYPGMTCTLADLETQQALLTVGGFIRHAQPLLNHRLRKAVVQNDAKMAVIQAIDHDWNMPITEKILALPGQWLNHLQGILLAAKGETQGVTLQQQAIANLLRQSERKIILLGAEALQGPFSGHLLATAQSLARLTGADLALLSDGPNAAGAWLAGATPHRLPTGAEIPSPGMSVLDVWHNPRRAYFLWQVEPAYDVRHPGLAKQALLQADLVVAMNTFADSHLLEVADIILPVAGFAETEGSFINLCGQSQTFAPAVACPGDSKQGWKLLRVLGNFFQLQGFDYQTIQDVRVEYPSSLQTVTALQKDELIEFDLNLLPATTQIPEKLATYPLWSMYRTDGLVRRSHPLQATLQPDQQAVIKLHPETAKQYGCDIDKSVVITQASVRITLPLMCDMNVIPGMAVLPMAFAEIADLKDSDHPIKIMPSLQEN